MSAGGDGAAEGLRLCRRFNSSELFRRSCYYYCYFKGGGRGGKAEAAVFPAGPSPLASSRSPEPAAPRSAARSLPFPSGGGAAAGITAGGADGLGGRHLCRVNALRAGLCKGAGKGWGKPGCTLLRRVGRDEGCIAALCPFQAGVCAVCERPRPSCVPPPGGRGRRGARDRGEPAAAEPAPAIVLRQNIAVVPVLLVGLATRRQRRAVPPLGTGRAPEQRKRREGWSGGVRTWGRLRAWDCPRARSLWELTAAAPCPLLPVVPLRGLLDPLSHPFLFPFLAPSVFPLPLVLLSSLPCSLVPPLPSPPGSPARRPFPVAPIPLPPADSCFLHFHPDSLLSSRWLSTAGSERDNKLGTGAVGKVGGAVHRLLTDLLKGLGELASEMLWLQFRVKHGSSAGWAGCEGFLKATSVSVQDESKLHNVLHEKKKEKKKKVLLRFQ